MTDLEIQGRKAYCGTGGSAWQARLPLALLLHGAGSDHTVWALQARSLAQHGWNVAAPDLPGHGASEDLDAITTIADYADWTVDFAAAAATRAGSADIALVGHSMGACIAVDAASRLNGRLSRLALLGAGETLRVNPGLLADTLKRPLDAHRFIAAFGHGTGAHFGGAESPGLWMLGSTMALLDRCLPEVLHRDFSACNEWEGSESAPGVTCPTLVVAGAKDRMTPPRAGRALAERIRGGSSTGNRGGAGFVTVADAGHMLMAEAPGAVTRCLRGFLGAQ